MQTKTSIQNKNKNTMQKKNKGEETKSDENEDSKNEERIHASITVIENSPLLDIVGIGYSNGYIVLHNLKIDQQIMCFHHFNYRLQSDVMHHNTPIHDLAFRKDGIPYLVSVSTDTKIVVWDLKTRKLHQIYETAHHNHIYSAKFLEDEPILLTSSSDNSLKLWIFDKQDGSCRLFKQRFVFFKKKIK